MPSWTLSPGDHIIRTELHRLYGGRRQGGIGPSASTPNVFIFSDPESGERHGYYDGWKDDGLFHYSGEGQRGDQEMKQGNLAIRDHASQGRQLRLFYGAGGEVTYAGEFEYVDDYETDAPETGGGPLRKVIVFKLREVGPRAVRPPSTTSSIEDAPRGSANVAEVGVESQNTEDAVQRPGQPPSTADRREARLQARFKERAEAAGMNVSRLRVTPAGEARPIFNDLLLDHDVWLIEVKGSVTREAIRMAIGQLADYGRFAPSATRAILVPSEPRSDLKELARTVAVTVIWEDDQGDFIADGGRFF